MFTVKSILWACLLPVLATPQYQFGPDSKRRPDVPKGTVSEYSWNSSKIYPGTTRKYFVYVPAQYDGSKPACLMVFQDGSGYVNESGSFRVPIVFDNLIAQNQMPVTIGVFVDPGVLPALSPESQQNRYNRSYEYDALGDRYARFLLDEIVPEVSKNYKLSKEPNDRAIGGSSSGGIAAFTVAWNHAESFHRVLSFIGSFADLRGGDIYPALIRKTEPKPLRVFLQDGTNDLNLFAGSWYLSNQSMYSALQYAGYESTFVVGTEGHNGKHGGAILPDALRWLWKGYPAAVSKPSSSGVDRHFVAEILDPSSDWQLASSDIPQPQDFTIIESKQDISFQPRYGGKRLVLQRERSAADALQSAAGAVFSPDHSLLHVRDGVSRFVWSYQIQPDGSLTNAEPFYRLEIPDNPQPRTAPVGMSVDIEGYLYVPTELGIQVCDQPGRVVAIINNPESGFVSTLAFGGPDLQSLYATAGDKVYSRHLRRKGTQPSQAVKPPQPRL